MMLWSYVLAAIGIFGIYLAGRRNLWGWAIGVGAQVLWVIYAVATGQFGFIISAIAYSVVYGRNWAKWAQEKRAEEVARLPHPTAYSVRTCDK